MSSMAWNFPLISPDSQTPLEIARRQYLVAFLEIAATLSPDIVHHEADAMHEAIIGISGVLRSVGSRP